MKCDECLKGVEVGPMYRVNQLGEKGIFRHKGCGGVPIDSEIEQICDLIHYGVRHDLRDQEEPKPRE